MIFEGQKRFEELLREVDCSRSIHDIYFFLRGLLAGTQVSPPSVWFGWLFDGKEPVFESQEQAQRLMGNVMGLWNLINSSQHDGKPLPKIITAFPDTVEGVVSRVESINNKTNAFIKGLDYAGTDPMEMTPDGRQAMKDMTKSDVFCTQYAKLAKKEKIDQKESNESHELIDEMEAIIEDCVQRISLSLDEARKTAVPTSRQTMPKRSEKISRNEPCPCGSGKKYKKCCWLKVH